MSSRAEDFRPPRCYGVGMRVLPKTVDRSIAKMIATKRIVTGSASVITGIVFLVILAAHGTRPPPIAMLALAIFFAGGGWTLRDGLRLRRDLHRS